MAKGIEANHGQASTALLIASVAEAASSAAARLHEFCPPSPLVESSALSARFGCTVLLKNEHLMPTGSFKFRGAYNRIALLSEQERAAGVVAASSGNHGLGLAVAARQRGVCVEIHAPSGASSAKLRAIAAQGAKLVLHEGDCLAAEIAARAAASAAGACYVSPYNDFDVIAGQGGIAVELLEQAAEIDAVVLSVGGGGLLCGVGSVLACRSPHTELIGAWPANATSLLRSMKAGRAVPTAESPTISDATAGEVEPGSMTIPLSAALQPTPVEVPEDRIIAGMRMLAEDEHWMVEGAAGLALAGLGACAQRLAGKTVAVVICGRNIALDRFLAAIA